MQGYAVIALTANAVSGSREIYISEGFDEYLSKPVSQDRLEKLIITFLPEELLKQTDSKNKIKDTADAESTNELPEIEGIDWQFALSHVPDAELIRETATTFYASMDYEEIIAYLNILGNAMSDMDIDEADETMRELLRYSYPENIIQDIEELKTAVETIDDVLAADIINRLLAKLPK